MILTKDNSIQTLKNNGTPLMFALSEGHISVAKELLEHGADLHKETTTGISAFKIAKQKNDPIVMAIISDAHKKSGLLKNWINKIIN